MCAVSVSKSATSTSSRDPWDVDMSDSNSDAAPKGYYFVLINYPTPMVANVRLGDVGICDFYCMSLCVGLCLRCKKENSLSY